MPLRSLRTRLVALFLVSLTIAAFLFAAVALRQFTQEERSRARSDLSRQSLQIVKLIEEFAEKRLNGEAGAPPDFATSLGGITNTNVYFVGRGGLSAPIDEVNFGQAPKGTEERLNWSLLGKEGKAQTLNLKLADGTSTIAAAAGFRYGKPLIGAIVVARPVRSINTSTLVQGRRFVPPLLLALAAAALVALLLSRRITRPVRELTEASERIALRRLRRAPELQGPGRARPAGAPLRADGAPAQGGERARAQLPDAHLARAAHAADRHPGPRPGDLRRRDRRRGRAAGVARDRARGGRPPAAADRRPARPRPSRDAQVLAQRRGGRRRRPVRARRRRPARGGSRAPHRSAGGRRRAARRARRRRSHPADRHEPDHERAARDARRRRRDGRRHGSARAWGR